MVKALINANPTFPPDSLEYRTIQKLILKQKLAAGCRRGKYNSSIENLVVWIHILIGDVENRWGEIGMLLRNALRVRFCWQRVLTHPKAK